MTNWGAVCVGPNYTHAGSGSTPDNEGWCPENDRRARACLTILASLGYVDTNRVAAYGNSMGAFVTAGFCGAVRSQIRAGAITAGGCSGSTDTSFASPAVQEVQGITAPFLMLHGTADTTVPPAQSATLQAILTSNALPNDRVLFDGVGHNLHNDRSNEVYTLMRAAIGGWFGTGPARGIALVFTVAGAIGLVVTLLAFRSRAYQALSARYRKGGATGHVPDRPGPG